MVLTFCLYIAFVSSSGQKYLENLPYPLVSSSLLIPASPSMKYTGFSKACRLSVEKLSPHNNCISFRHAMCNDDTSHMMC